MITYKNTYKCRQQKYSKIHFFNVLNAIFKIIKNTYLHLIYIFSKPIIRMINITNKINDQL